MSEKPRKIVYWITTGLLTVIVLMYAGNSIFNYEMFSQRFSSLGYPTYIIYPLTTAKLLGLTAIWSNLTRTLKEWAYAGFFFDFALAMMADIRVDNGEYFSSSIAIVCLLISYNLWKMSIQKTSTMNL